MYNDKGNVATYLPTDLPTHPLPTFQVPTYPLAYLPTHSPTYLLLQPTYLLPTILQLVRI
jgi:hypothetical protein